MQEVHRIPREPSGKTPCNPGYPWLTDVQSCVLCPNEGGAFKQTVHGDWVHLLCAIWVPETRVANDVFMEPITGIDKISKQRWRLVSYTTVFLIASDTGAEVFFMRSERGRVHPV